MSENELTMALMQRYEAMLNHSGRAELLSRAKRLLRRSLRASALHCKRDCDIIGALLLIMATFPLLLLVALLIKIEDRGPVMFCQTRVGRNGRTFKMYKFRSMCIDADKKKDELLHLNQHSAGVTFKIKDDPRVTRVGKWIRKFSLDELPQFFNVLAGDMSLVGPRPPVPREVALYSLHERQRLCVTPGITCFWQVGGRSEIDFSGQVKLDIDYIEQQGLWTDVKILLKTVPAVFRSKGAY